MERHEEIHKTRTQIFFNNFLGGIAWALGATVGVSIVLGIFVFILSKINFVPVVGNFASNVVNYVLISNPHLLFK